MRPTHYRWIAAASLIAIAVAAHAATRPHYGGTLRVVCSAALESLDPAATPALSRSEAASERVAGLIFDTLVRLDENAHPQPQLAHTWQHSDDYKRWQFWLRPGVTVQDGTPLTPAVVVAAIRRRPESWRVDVLGESIVIESDTPMPGLLADLARARNSIVIATPDGPLLGTGPFRVAEFQPGRHIVLQANEDYWAGRPFLDEIDIALGQPLRDQAMNLQLGRADVIEIDPDQVRHALDDRRRVAVSSPAELMGLFFPRSRATDAAGRAREARVREALWLAIDRVTINNVLLQRQGEPATSLLPQWISGFAFAFDHGLDLKRARQARAESGWAAPLIIAYDPAAALARSVAERVAVNGRDAGLTVQAQALNTRGLVYDAVLFRAPLQSADAQAALIGLAPALFPNELPQLRVASDPVDEFVFERGLNVGAGGVGGAVVPIVHLPEAFGLSARVNGWTQPRDGSWRLADVWVSSQQDKSTDRMRTEKR